MRPVITLLFFFVAVQLLGLFTATVVLPDLGKNPYLHGLTVTSDIHDVGNAVLFIVYILLGAAVLIAAMHWLELHNIVLRVVEFVLVAAASSTVFYATLRLLGGYEVTIVAVGLGVVLAAAEEFRRSLRNEATVLTAAGVGTILGSALGIVPAMVFLALLAVYDYLSVYATKHMQKLANLEVDSEVAFAVTAEDRNTAMDLGIGDLIAPTLLAVSAWTVSPWAAAFIFTGATISAAIFLFVLWRNQVMLPALPPIIAGAIAGYFIGISLGYYGG